MELKIFSKNRRYPGVAKWWRLPGVGNCLARRPPASLLCSTRLVKFRGALVGSTLVVLAKPYCWVHKARAVKYGG